MFYNKYNLLLFEHKVFSTVYQVYIKEKMYDISYDSYKTNHFKQEVKLC